MNKFYLVKADRNGIIFKYYKYNDLVKYFTLYEFGIKYCVDGNTHVSLIQTDLYTRDVYKNISGDMNKKYELQNEEDYLKFRKKFDKYFAV